MAQGIPEVDPQGCSQNRLEKTVFVWVDILGFAEALEKEEKYVELTKALEEFQISFNETDLYFSRVISDGIVLWLKNPNPENLVLALKQLGTLQHDFVLKKKRFLRGGISLGSRLVIDKRNNDNFISNGLARAVMIEERRVTWPVIGLPRECLEEINRFLSVASSETHGLCQGLNELGDDLFFIDFLNDSDEMLGLIKHELDRFTPCETNRKPSSKVRAKYLWLLKYYISKFGPQELPQCIGGAIL